MTAFASIDEAKDFFKNDRFAEENGIELLEITDDSCVCSMKIRPEHLNAANGVMGGVIFTLADFAFAVVTNNIHLPSVGQQNSITFLSSPKGDTLIAKCKCRKSGKTTTIASVDISDNSGRDIAMFSGTSFKL